MAIEISNIQFGIISEDEIRRNSVVEVVCHDMYEKGVPKPGSLTDLRLGTIDRCYNCQTCFGDIINCPGHFGHINLSNPVHHIGFIKTVLKILQCVCLECETLYCDSKFNTFKKCYDNCKVINICEHCEAEKEKLFIDNYKIYKQTKENELTPEYIHRLFSNLECDKMGLNSKYAHPKNMILTCITVPPPQVRPSISMDSIVKSQDDLTHKLIEIIKTNNLIKKLKLGENQEHAISEATNLLQFHINTYIDNEMPGQIQATQRTGRPIKGICQRLKSKEGRIRNNLMGKRVDFSARTVITAEPNIDLDELGVPHDIATNLTFPEVVTNFNKHILQEYVNNGPNAEFGKVGAKYIISKDKKKKDLRFAKSTIEVGDTVERHMKDGDLVIFNRQPTLHKMSMMGHKVKIMEGFTFRMNLAATSPYNADFDGDEMNLHLPQSYVAKAEIQNLMMVSNNIVSSQSNKPVIGIVQDSLLSCSKLTADEVFINKDLMFNIILKIKNIEQELQEPIKNELWSGKQLVNMIIPKGLFYNKKGNFDEVIIENGIYKSGTLCKKSLGTSEGGLIHTIWLMYGAESANKFISNIQYIANEWILHNGFTIGFGDTQTIEETKNEVKEALKEADEKVKQLIEVKSKNENVNPEIFENKINQVLNNAISKSGRCIQENISKKNNIQQMVSGGSKGSIINIAQIMGSVGQQNVNGKRISMGYTDRPLSHFKRNDIGPEARGFVKNSYLKGLSPHEFFYHAMGGREGIIDTAVKTSSTGYIERRLIKAMEDLKVHLDKSYRNSNNDILQFVYGEDGMDGAFLISQTLNVLTEKEIQSERLIKDEKIILKELIKKIDKYFPNKTTINYKSPVVLDKLLKQTFANNKGKKSTQKYIFSKVDELCKSIKICPKNTNTAKMINNNCTLFLRYMLYSQLRSTKMHQLSNKSIDSLIDSIKYQIDRAIIQSGEMMGTVAAQSISQPVTQLTLNSFHFSGISTKSVTLGVPRIQEIINVAKNIKSPSMEIYIKDGYEAEQIANELENISLKQLIKDYKTILLSDSNEFEEYDLLEHIECDLSSYYIKLIFDINELRSKRLTIVDVSANIYNLYEENIIVNIKFPDVIYIRILKETDEYEEQKTKNFMIRLINTFELSGISEIEKVYIDDNKIDTDGTCLLKILGQEGIDYKKTISNDQIEISNVLGIDATREVIIKELKKVIEFDGGYVNYRHLASLVDTMTNKGIIMSITRHGINRCESGPLMKCSFEETVDVLLDAGMFAEKDHIKGVAEAITVGKMCNMGTGSFDTFLNLNKINGTM